ncbi:hypothetical protein [Photobacterium leiognathi]|nr:hypothetical protein [Photobacterium leiognathi]
MVFSLDTTDVDLKKKMNQIGQQAFSELISYFISEALYRESVKLSKKADSVLKELGDDIHDELIEQLQKSSLHNLHSYSNHFGKDVKLRYRKSRVTQTVLAHVDRKSYKSLVPKTDNTKITIEASITRFNINTGNGRLLIKGDDKTVAFGFLRKYKDIQQHHKKTFTSNLDKCNGIPNDNWETLKLECTTLKNSCNEVVKYLIRGVL